MTVIANSQDGSRQHFSATSIVDSTGATVIQFLPPLSKYWTGGATVYDSMDQVQWMVAVNGIVIDVVQGAATTSSIQLGPGDVLTLTSRNAVGGQTYHATFSAVVTPEDNTNLITPSHDPYHQPFSAVNIGNAVYTNISGAQTFSFPIPSYINSVLVIGAAYNDIVTLQNFTPPYMYFNSNTKLGGAFSPIWVDVMPNSTLQVSWTPSATSGTLSIVGLPEPSSYNNTPQNPLYAKDIYDGLACTLTNTTVPAGNTVTLINAPPAGFVNDIKTLCCNAGTSAANVAQACYMRTNPTGAFLIGLYAQVAGIFVNQSYDHLYITEGIQLVNSTAVSATGFVFYRQLPIWYAT